MSKRAYTQAAVAALIVIGLGPAAAHADAQGGGTGGTSSGGGTSAGGPSGPSGASGATGASGPSGASGQSGATAQPTGPTTWLGRTIPLSGSLGSGAAGQPILVERLSPTQGRWVSTARTTADDHGAFTVSWRATEAGHLAFRARVQTMQAGSAQASSSDGGTPIGDVTVYRSALVTWFGSGSYGHKTACGEQMTHQLQGVASRTLPCGTIVELSYRDTTVTVPVVDRGPYSKAKFDLTYATAKALNFTRTGSAHIGTLVLGRSTSSAPTSASGGSGA